MDADWGKVGRHLVHYWWLVGDWWHYGYGCGCSEGRNTRTHATVHVHWCETHRPKSLQPDVADATGDTCERGSDHGMYELSDSSSVSPKNNSEK